jgi:hypothetical protein
MSRGWQRSFEDMTRRYPVLMVAVLVAMAGLVTLLLLAQARGQVILYQEF